MNVKTIILALVLLGAITVGGTIVLNRDSKKEPEMVYRKPATIKKKSSAPSEPLALPLPEQNASKPAKQEVPTPPVLDKAKADVQVEQVLNDLQKIQQLPPEERAKAMSQYREMLLQQNGIKPATN